MPRKKSEPTKVSKPAVRKVQKEEPKKDSFTFGKMTKEERDTIIKESLFVKAKPKMEYTLEETQYTPKEWVVVVTNKGAIYQEPVPRYFPFKDFVGILVCCPSEPIVSNTIDFEGDLNYTSFDVSGVDCNIVTTSFNGQRKENPYANVFDIKNSTTKIGGNIVFAGSEKGFTEKQAQSVVKAIIKKFDKYEEIV